MMSKSDFEKIHAISNSFNRFFSWPIYIFSSIVVALMVFLPYRGRLTLAFIINIFFNRPTVYLSYLKKYFIRPLVHIAIDLFYFVVIGIYAVLYRLKNREPRHQWKKSPPLTDLENGRYQS